MDEKAQSVTSLEERRALEQNFELRLKEIEQTLHKIDQGTYGTCNTCNSPIEEKRLQALPAVSSCFDCASNPSLS